MNIMQQIEHKQMLSDIEELKLNLERLTNAVEMLATKPARKKAATKKSTKVNGEE